MTSTYLITGGAGFIGSNLARGLLTAGNRVRILDNFSTGFEHNLSGLDVELVRGDIRDADAVATAVAGCGVVCHLAAAASVARSVEDPVTTNEINVTGTLQVLEQARRAGVGRVVFAGSSAVYGDAERLPKVETMAPAPLSPYALQKLAGESYCRLYTRLYGLDAVTVRFFNVYGPQQDPGSEYSAVIPKFITMIRDGRVPTIYGDGLQTRDFSYVDNAIEGVMKAAVAPDAPGGVYNIANGSRISLLDLVARINEFFGKSIVPTLSAPRPGDILHSFGDIEAARRDLGYTAAVNFGDGLNRTAQWYTEAGQ